LRRDPPQHLKGSRTFDLAAGGCPALPSCEGGVRAGCPRVRAWGRVVPWPAYRVGGRANRRPSAVLPSCEGMRRGNGADEGVPPCGGPLSPCRQQVVWRAAARKNTPCGGQAVLRTLDDYQIFTGRFQMRSFTTSPGKAGLRVQAGDTHTRVNGAACRGPPVVRGCYESRHSVP
jgi:hypothetical protein